MKLAGARLARDARVWHLRAVHPGWCRAIRVVRGGFDAASRTPDTRCTAPAGISTGPGSFRVGRADHARVVATKTAHAILHRRKPSPQWLRARASLAYGLGGRPRPPRCCVSQRTNNSTAEGEFRWSRRHLGIDDVAYFSPALARAVASFACCSLRLSRIGGKGMPSSRAFSRIAALPRLRATEARDAVAPMARSLRSFAISSSVHGINQSAAEPLLHLLAAVADLLDRLLHCWARGPCLLRLVSDFVVLPACNAGAVLLPATR